MQLDPLYHWQILNNITTPRSFFFLPYIYNQVEFLVLFNNILTITLYIYSKIYYIILFIKC